MIIAYPLGFWTPEIHLLGKTIAPIHITGFGIMMMLSFVVGAWLMDRESRRHGFNPEYAGDAVLGAVLGGIIGAKLWFVALHGPRTLFDRGGLVWYGGFVGGAIGVALNGWRRRVPARWTAQLVAPALAAGYAIGRVGCFVVGDDYGRPTTLPWGVAFPEGMPRTTAAMLTSELHTTVPPGTPPDAVLAVHPTQLYEVTIMLVVFAILWKWRTKAVGTGWLFGAYLMFAGLERFAVEFLRAKDDRLLGAFTIAQAMSLLVATTGVVVMMRLRDAGQISPGPWLQKKVS